MCEGPAWNLSQGQCKRPKIHLIAETIMVSSTPGYEERYRFSHKECDDGDKEKDASDEGCKRNLMDAYLCTPNSDEEVHGNQHRFPEEIKRTEPYSN
jgi:hypothetical protein